MKKILLTGAVVVMTCVSSMAAVTADQLCWRNGTSPAYMVAAGDYSFYSLPTVQTANISLEKINDNTIRVHGFLNLVEYADFTLDGDQLILEAQDVPLKGSTQTVTICKGAVDYIGSNSYGDWYWNNGEPGTNWVGAITSRGEGAYSIVFTDPVYVWYGNASLDTLFANAQIVTYVPNAKVTDTVVTFNGASLDRSYEVNFDIKDGTFQIENFANCGQLLQAGVNNNVPYYNYSKANGTITDGTDSRTFSITSAPILVSLRATPYKAWQNVYHDDEWFSEYCYAPADCFFYNPKFGVLSGSTLSDVPGEIHAETAHNDANHGWTAKDGGLRTTAESVVGTIDDYVMYNDEEADNQLGLPYGTVQTIKNTKLDFGSNDVTLESIIDLTDASYNPEEGLKLSGSIATINNAKYVDNYELYLVPGTYSTVEGDENFNDAEKGHVNAISLSEYETTPVARASVADRDFYVQLPVEKVAEIDPESKGEMTLFAKANYKNHLTPTFHALTPVKVEINTGVESVFDNGANAKVVAGDGVISISGFNGIAKVYNVQGALVYSGSEKMLNVAPGIYIIRLANTTFKTIVR